MFVAVGVGTAASVRAVAGNAPALGAAVNVRDFGAAGDGAKLETAALQAALDACADRSGGVVLVPPGVYLTGSLQLRSRVKLHLAHGARIKGSPNLADYPVRVSGFRSYTDNYTDKSLISGENLEDVAIEGTGVLDGQGAAFEGPYKSRPYLLRLVKCRGVHVRDIRFESSPMWVQHYLACEDVRLTGLTVRSRVNHNNDGIDIDSCRRVRVSDCDISSGDDAICLKSTCELPCEDVIVSNCLISSNCNAIKLGTESNGGFRNIVVSNCSIYDTRLAGIALETVDGGALRGITISNLEMRNVGGPIFVRLGNRARPIREGDPRPGSGSLREILIGGVHAVGAGPVGCSVTGLPSASVEDLVLQDVRIEYQGGGTSADATREVPELADAYPEYSMFKNLPAYGFYIRHARRIRLAGVRVRTATRDLRPSLVCEDVERLDVDRFEGAVDADAEAVARFNGVRDARVSHCRSLGPARAFLSLRGSKTSGIRMIGNDLSGVASPVIQGSEVDAGVVTSDSNS